MVFDPSDPVRSVFADIVGLPAWQVKRGYGSFLTLEFGRPHLRVREPRISTSTSEKVRASAARRLVTIRGDWHLWIYCCDWRVLSSDELIGTSDGSDQAMAQAAAALDGQHFTAVEVDPAAGASLFRFDLGGRLETQPYAERTYENWMLYCPDGNVLTYRGDGAVSWGACDTGPDEKVWTTASTRGSVP